MSESVRPDFVEWGVAECSLPGQAESGDASLVAQVPNGILVAVIDGLGHGAEAAQASQLALKVLREHAGDKLDTLVERCHKALRYSRGVVMTLAEVNSSDETMTWLGVGNVEGRLLKAYPVRERPTDSPLLRGGVVGHKVPPVRASTVGLSRGDLIIVATDGVSPGFVDHLAPRGSPQQIADSILENHWRGKDDALVLVARYLGPN